MPRRYPSVLASLLGALWVLSACGPMDDSGDAGDPEPDPPSLAGGWKGTYECGADSKKLSAALAEDEDGVVDGEMFLDYQIVILGTPLTLTGRANVDDGALADGVYSGFVDVLDNSQGLPDYLFSLSLDEAGDEVTGDFTRENADGEVIQTCPVQLARVEVMP